MNFDFEEAMQTGLEFQRDGMHEEALAVRLAAYHAAADGSIERGRAARDISASYDRLHMPSSAIEYAEDAYDIHHALVWKGLREARRERAASAMQVGGMALRAAISLERQNLTGPDLQDAIWKARDMLQKADKDIKHEERKKPDQYRVNLTGRRALAEGLYGRMTRGLKLGMQATALASVSESPRFIANTTPDLSTRDKLKVRARAALRGIVAVGVTAMRVVPGTRVRKLALTLADKAL
jgi:hypothetical protein